MTNHSSHSSYAIKLSSVALFSVFICLGIVFYPISKHGQSFLEFQETKDIVLVHLRETINLRSLLSYLIDFFKQEEINYQPIKSVQRPASIDTYKVDESAIYLLPKGDLSTQDTSDLSDFIINESIKE